MRRRVRIVAVVLGLIALRGAAAAQVVQGRLLEAGTGDPLAAATIQLRQAERRKRVVAAGVTDGDGRFVLRAPATGTYVLHAERLGFKAVNSPRFDLIAGAEPLEVELSLGVEAVPLAPLAILSDRPARLNLRLQAYYDRRKEWGKEGLGFGYFLEGEELRNATRVSDLVGRVPGVWVQAVGGTRRSVVMRGPYTIQQVDRCVPTVFVDGEQAGTGTDIDDLVSPAEVAAIEVYPGISKPPELEKGQLCGAVVIWTGGRPRR